MERRCCDAFLRSGRTRLGATAMLESELLDGCFAKEEESLLRAQGLRVTVAVGLAVGETLDLIVALVEMLDLIVAVGAGFVRSTVGVIVAGSRVGKGA
jgi:hypothetical protein